MRPSRDCIHRRNRDSSGSRADADVMSGAEQRLPSRPVKRCQRRSLTRRPAGPPRWHQGMSRDAVRSGMQQRRSPRAGVVRHQGQAASGPLLLVRQNVPVVKSPRIPQGRHACFQPTRIAPTTPIGGGPMVPHPIANLGVATTNGWSPARFRGASQAGDRSGCHSAKAESHGPTEQRPMDLEPPPSR